MPCNQVLFHIWRYGTAIVTKQFANFSAGPSSSIKIQQGSTPTWLVGGEVSIDSERALHWTIGHDLSLNLCDVALHCVWLATCQTKHNRALKAL